MQYTRHATFVYIDANTNKTHVSMKGSGESYMICQKKQKLKTSPETSSALDMPDYDNLAIQIQPKLKIKQQIGAHEQT